MSRSSSVAAVPIPPGLSHAAHAAMLLAHQPKAHQVRTPLGVNIVLHKWAHKSHMQQDEVLMV